MLNETSWEEGRRRDLKLMILDLLQLSLRSFIQVFYVSEPVCEGGKSGRSDGFHGDVTLGIIGNPMKLIMINSM